MFFAKTLASISEFAEFRNLSELFKIILSFRSFILYKPPPAPSLNKEGVRGVVGNTITV
jgi:hypothetical protein